jgi:signal transduction histidine kinase
VRAYAAGYRVCMPSQQRADEPRHVLSALARPRYLLSRWPWRALLFCGTSLVVIGVAALVLSPVSLSWTGLLANASDGHVPEPEIAVLTVLATVFFVAAGPLAALPIAAVERLRLGIVDARPVTTGHRVPRPGLFSWLVTRYTEAATWREVLYLCLLGTVAPIAYGGIALAAFVTAFLLISPIVVTMAGGGTVVLFGPVDDVPGTLPYVVAGIIAVPLLAYAVGLLSAGHDALARLLLGGGRDVELREVARSRTRLVDAFDAERRRIERDLHDGAQHRLTSLTLQLGVARLDLPDDSPAAVALDKAHTEAKDLMVVLRDLVHGIRPQILADLGLPAALQDLADRSALDVAVVVDPTLADRYPVRVENTAYFAASEALGNVGKHAEVKAAEIRLARSGDTLILEVRDQGRGGADAAGGSGLTGLADRIAAVNGRLLLSSPPGGPTLVRVELPCLT